jgi:HEAT repeat protein
MRSLPFLLLCLATFAVAQSPDEKAWQKLQHGLGDSNPLKRAQVLIAMGVLTPQPRVNAAVEEKLGDKEVNVRQAACVALGGIKSKTSIPKLREALNDKAPEVVFAAAKALYEMDDPTGRQVLIAVLSGDQPDASGFITSSIRDMKSKLHDPKAMLLIGATEGAGFVIGPFGAGIPIAEGLLKDKQASGKTVAALLLATDHSKASEEALKGALNDKNWTVRSAAARAVALRDLAPMYKDVAFLLDDSRDEVQYAAAATLIRLRQPGRKPARTKSAQVKPAA